MSPDDFIQVKRLALSNSIPADARIADATGESAEFGWAPEAADWRVGPLFAVA